MFSVFFRLYKTIFVIILLLSILFTPLLYSFYHSNSSISDESTVYSSFDFVWPIPGYTNISSYFGRRASPTAGASSFHSGIDIPAPEGTNLYAIHDGYVIFSSWGAGGGYTITYELIDYPRIKVSYCHVSPVMYVSAGDYIYKGQLIGSVGPKNIYGINNNPYRDSNGNPTNGASTGCHLHFTIKYNGSADNPLNYYDLE